MHPMRPRTALVAAVIVVTVVALAAPFLRSYTRAAALIVRLASIPGWPTSSSGNASR